jgi:hypothetical protein
VRFRALCARLEPPTSQGGFSTVHGLFVPVLCTMLQAPLATPGDFRGANKPAVLSISFEAGARSLGDTSFKPRVLPAIDAAQIPVDDAPDRVAFVEPLAEAGLAESPTRATPEPARLSSISFEESGPPDYTFEQQILPARADSATVAGDELETMDADQAEESLAGLGLTDVADHKTTTAPALHSVSFEGGLPPLHYMSFDRPVPLAMDETEVAILNETMDGDELMPNLFLFERPKTASQTVEIMSFQPIEIVKTMASVLERIVTAGLGFPTPSMCVGSGADTERLTMGGAPCGS